jgi:formate hydrogenlyase transcriptional activator
MPSASVQSRTAQTPAARWLAEHGPRELELLFRAIVYHPAVPILIADNDRNSLEASVGTGKLLGLPREKIVGRKLDDFAEPRFKPQIPELWRAFLDRGEQDGTLHLQGADGGLRAVEYKAKTDVLPVRHVLTLREKTTGVRTGETASPDAEQIPSLGAGLCAFPVGSGRTCCRLVFGSGASFRLHGG